MTTAYLQHGHGTQGPFQTEQVPVKRDPMAWHKNPRLTYTASGYGEKIPTEYKIHWRGRWRRVYCRIFSNVGTLYILTSESETGRIVVQVDHD